MFFHFSVQLVPPNENKERKIQDCIPFCSFNPNDISIRQIFPVISTVFSDLALGQNDLQSSAKVLWIIIYLRKLTLYFSEEIYQSCLSTGTFACKSYMAPPSVPMNSVN